MIDRHRQRARLVAGAHLIDVDARVEQRPGRLRITLTRGEQQWREATLRADELGERNWRVSPATSGLFPCRLRTTAARASASSGLRCGLPSEVTAAALPAASRRRDNRRRRGRHHLPLGAQEFLFIGFVCPVRSMTFVVAFASAPLAISGFIASTRFAATANINADWPRVDSLALTSEPASSSTLMASTLPDAAANISAVVADVVVPFSSRQP